ncbi:hypothetical protein PR048_004114 [Dryococelus australis]|uniref:Uncharacterized protein n=1 Tax=Dryococelus australis TaxID=614101 RepID=A0ABQ9I4M8_9NEOP|nr:hypothetical protein PR048_004114 [Dryococelus australis]
MDSAGFSRTAKQIIIKWKALIASLFKAQRKNETSGVGPEEAPFQKLLEQLLGSRPSCTASHSTCGSQEATKTYIISYDDDGVKILQSIKVLAGEQYLVEAIIYTAKCGYPLDRNDLQYMVCSYVQSVGRKTPFKDDTPGCDFIVNFERRWKEELNLNGFNSIRIETQESILKVNLAIPTFDRPGHRRLQYKHAGNPASTTKHDETINARGVKGRGNNSEKLQRVWRRTERGRQSMLVRSFLLLQENGITPVIVTPEHSTKCRFPAAKTSLSHRASLDHCPSLPH